jgi:hypothetical protein
MDKSAEYVHLVQQRKRCQLCTRDGLVNPAEIVPNLDSNEIGPWTRWQGNLNAKLMIVGQDWGDDRYFCKNDGREAPANPTNETLRRLIRELGIEIDSPCDLGRDGDLYFTNAILGLKQDGDFQGPVRDCRAAIARVSGRTILPQHRERFWVSRWKVPRGRRR